jgi:hypothetical protein
MEIYLLSIKEALEKDLILVYLRNIPNRLVNILEIRDKVFFPAFPFEKVRQYAEELKQDKLVSTDKHNPSDIGHIPNDPFIELGGHVRKFFEFQKIDFSATSVAEAHHKDLILYFLFYLNKQNSNQLTDLNDLRKTFPSTYNLKIRYYVDELRNNSYINPMGNDDYIFRYYPLSDKFLEEGGYVGKYLQQVLEAIEVKKLSDEEKLSPEELQAKRKFEKRKEFIEKRKTGILYFSLKYGWLIILGIIVILIALIKIGIITQENAIAFVTWIIDRIK